MAYENKGAVATTIVVAASDSLNYHAANYYCTGTNDHLVIQEALDALPATGGEVLLLDGTYYIEVSLVLDSYQTLSGCGRNTILATSTANLVFLSAIGGSGTEKIGIVITDLQIDGGAGAVSDLGIYFEYVDYSFIWNVYSRRHASGTGSYRAGIYLDHSDFNLIVDNTCRQNNYDGIDLVDSLNNTVMGNICQGNNYDGIWLNTSNNNLIADNDCQGNGNAGIHTESATLNDISGNLCMGNTGSSGIYLDASSHNNITGNICQGNDIDGIYLWGSSNNTITGNTCQGNTEYGIQLLSASHNNTITGNTCQGNSLDNIALYNGDKNTVTGNICQGSINSNGICVYTNGNTIAGNTIQGNACYGIELAGGNNNSVIGNTLTENSQETNNLYDDIFLSAADYNNIQGNTCRAGALANKPRYGINISNAACDGNLVIDNDLYNDGFVTAPFNDAGTGTKLNNYKVPFSDGSDPQDSGFLIDADTEYARAWLRLPNKVVQVVRMKVYARSVVTEADKMRGEFVVFGGADNEAYNTHNGSIANHPSTSSNFAADDVIYWTLTTAGVLALLGGDSVEVKVLHEAAGNGDCATNAYLRTVEIEYV